VVIQSFTYDDAWYPQTDGGGYSLVIRDPSGDLSNWGTQAGWRASYAPLGLPGQDDADTTPPVEQSANFDAAAARVQFFFSEPVSIASSSGVTVTEMLSGNSVTPAGLSASGNAATVSLPALADGIYAVMLPA